MLNETNHSIINTSLHCTNHWCWKKLMLSLKGLKGMKYGLRVSDPPIVSVELGSNLNGSFIREGMDVYFECIVQANPRLRKIQWLHNVSYK